ncbi:MAG: DinB family protein [Flavobacteriales bacterium]
MLKKKKLPAMTFDLHNTMQILERTPSVLEAMLTNLAAEWTMANEGPDTFSPFDVVGHLVHGEKTDWIPRLEIVLSHGADRVFEPYDRFAQYTESKGKDMTQLLAEFRALRQANLEILKSKNLKASDMDRKGVHPSLGTVTLRELLATWAVHDLSHLSQITRVMCKQYKAEVGPWKAYLPVLTRY